MANLTDSTNLTGTITVSKATGTKVTLDTDHKYINKDIELTINATTASPTFTGGLLTNQNASASSTYANISTSVNNSGISIETQGTAGRAAITYNGAVNGWVTKNNGETANSAISTSNWNGTTYYLNGVNIPIPVSGYRTFNITVPNGDNDTITFVFKVYSNGDTCIESLSTISFTIDRGGSNQNYFANVDMTWGQWVESQYNIENYYIDGNYIKYSGDNRAVLDETIPSYVTPSTTIIANRTYRINSTGEPI